MPLMFEQQPKESAKAFAAFKTYLELGPQRSLAGAGDKLGKSKGMMEKWSRRFDWPARVQAHDNRGTKTNFSPTLLFWAFSGLTEGEDYVFELTVTELGGVVTVTEVAANVGFV